MSAKDVFNVIAYGWSNKSDNPEMIGMYGNGLKSGSMRVANDCLILTKKNDECSALMISRTFIENPDNKDVSLGFGFRKHCESKTLVYNCAVGST